MTRRTKDLTAGDNNRESTHRHTVSASAVRVLLELAVSRGASKWALAERSGIDLVDLQNNDNRLPFASYVALMRAGQELCKDPALALHFGEAVDPSEISFTSQLGPSAMSLEQCIALLNRYGALILEVDSDGDRLALEKIGGKVWIVDRRKHPNDFPEITESLFARVVSTTRRMFGANPFVLAVHVTHPEPPYRAEYDRIFQVPVTFDSDRNAFQISDAALMIFRPPSSRGALEKLTAHAESMLNQLENSKSLRARVESVLIPMLHTRKTNMAAVAKKLGLSRQTLFRRLKAEGVTFEQVLDELRHKLALDYVNEKTKSMKEIAYLVGFSDPAAFSRAFKRWTGSSPRAQKTHDRGRPK